LCERCGFKPSQVRLDPVARPRYLRHELQLQVNHIVPLVGTYRLVTCANHLSNLEVLCHRCHVLVTGEQRSSRNAASAAGSP
jgi:5-methylcytosine-specific restriction endonuclease McrA